MRKVFQLKFYSFLSSRWGMTCCVIGAFVSFNTIFQILSVIFLHQSDPSLTLASLGRIDYLDNIGHRSYEHVLCSTPIDIVYTWVNGSDPRHQRALAARKAASRDPNMRKCNETETPEKTNGECWQEEDLTSRFVDNQELKYSLRSIEAFAPWVRHVYIVTNGQIPWWLNLAHPRLTVVTHDEIFPNTSHLPTFSSPSIEVHLHRIPGISSKFIYLNDDVMFGREIYPDDFFTQNAGQKVFLSWPVPNCAEGCPSNWIGDGYCDQACNVTACEFDAGDCANVTSASSSRWSYTGGSSRGNTYSYTSNTDYSNRYKNYCAKGCPDTWIGDKYCDRMCKNLECGFDAGDCGTEDIFGSMYGLDITLQSTHFDLPDGLESIYFNLTSIVQNGTITDGSHDNSNLVRTATISQKHKIMTLTFHRNVTRQDVMLSISAEIPREGGNKTLVEHTFNCTLSTVGNHTAVNNETTSFIATPPTTAVSADGDALLSNNTIISNVLSTISNNNTNNNVDPGNASSSSAPTTPITPTTIGAAESTPTQPPELDALNQPQGDERQDVNDVVNIVDEVKKTSPATYPELDDQTQPPPSRKEGEVITPVLPTKDKSFPSPGKTPTMAKNEKIKGEAATEHDTPMAVPEIDTDATAERSGTPSPSHKGVGHREDEPLQFEHDTKTPVKLPPKSEITQMSPEEETQRLHEGEEGYNNHDANPVPPPPSTPKGDSLTHENEAQKGGGSGLVAPVGEDNDNPYTNNDNSNNNSGEDDDKKKKVDPTDLLMRTEEVEIPGDNEDDDNNNAQGGGGSGGKAPAPTQKPKSQFKKPKLAETTLKDKLTKPSKPIKPAMPGPPAGVIEHSDKPAPSTPSSSSPKKATVVDHDDDVIMNRDDKQHSSILQGKGEAETKEEGKELAKDVKIGVGDVPLEPSNQIVQPLSPGADDLTQADAPRAEGGSGLALPPAAAAATPSKSGDKEPDTQVAVDAMLLPPSEPLMPAPLSPGADDLSQNNAEGKTGGSGVSVSKNPNKLVGDKDGGGIPIANNEASVETDIIVPSSPSSPSPSPSSPSPQPSDHQDAVAPSTPPSAPSINKDNNNNNKVNDGTLPPSYKDTVNDKDPATIVAANNDEVLEEVKGGGPRSRDLKEAPAPSPLSPPSRPKRSITIDNSMDDPHPLFTTKTAPILQDASLEFGSLSSSSSSSSSPSSYYGLKEEVEDEYDSTETEQIQSARKYLEDAMSFRESRDADLHKIAKAKAEQLLALEAEARHEADREKMWQLNRDLERQLHANEPDYPWEAINELRGGRGGGRHLLDMFGDSLKFVNRMYNLEFGASARKVPAHMPHMIDRDIMFELQEKWPKQWNDTSSHSLRSSEDMQYAFAYFYYVIHARYEFNFTHIWRNELDMNWDGYLNENELRTLAIHIHGTPLENNQLNELITRLTNSCRILRDENGGQMVGLENVVHTERLEQMLDEAEFGTEDVDFCLITQEVVLACNKTMKDIKNVWGKRTKYRHQIEGTDDVAFLMIGDNDESTQTKLDGIRKARQKFICLNDNMNHSNPNSKKVVKVLHDFYDAILPRPSLFELPHGVRNTFLHMDDLLGARHLARNKRQYTYTVGIAMIAVVLVFICVCRHLTKNYDRRSRERRARKFLSV
eukprot:TRINITY_DN1152_c0_g1_i5.p1 TRINITY_DN1152_c0_g1~~TRINITY_DN1152_c0_g1_i5.p1  ORF type:complete len:1635 (-),score=329.21 TRINITY_DN1152_c0_g1_i5:43-4947(-)